MSDALHVTVSGAVNGEYIVEDRRADGALLLVRPEHSAAESLERLELRPASFEQAEQQFGTIAPDDGER